MNQRQNDPSEMNYKVSVNSEVVFTMNYDDSLGRLLFSIEFGNDPKTVFLNRHPSENGRMVDVSDKGTNARVILALERIKSHFINQGLNVKLDI
jgi:hypothetical protein